jgi:large subunit ribosomal protein L30
MFAIVRVRGSVKVRKNINDTLLMLRLKNVNNCIVIPEDGVYKGMIAKAKDYITWGEVSKDAFKKMLLKWGRTKNNKRVDEAYLKERGQDIETFTEQFFAGKLRLQDVDIKPVFRLHPPRKGYEGIKRPFTMKGALGYRGEKINDLLVRMI